MTRRPKALVGAAMLVAVVASTQVNARQKNRNIPDNSFDQHAVGIVTSAAPAARRQSYSRRAPAQAAARVASHTSRDCLHHSARAVLDKLEVRFGKVQLVSTCRPGARMPSGHVSLHALNRAFDFKVGKGIDKRDVMVWLGRNSPGVTMSYRNMDHIHTDTGTFHKVIYNAANHEAGERVVAVWKERARLAALPPQRERKSAVRRDTTPAPWTVTAGYIEPDFEYAIEPSPLRPEPITTWGDRRGIFQRYFESKDVVVMKHTSLSCSDGKPFPPSLVRLLNDAASHFGRTAYVNSGYRTPERNRRVGGARNSQHMKCRAVDFRVAGVGISDLRRWVVAQASRYGIGGLGTYRTHIHADARPLTKATRMVMWTGGQKKRVRYAKHRKPSRYASAG